MLAFLDEKERAREWATRARLVDPENVNLHYNLACAMSALGDVELTLTSIVEQLTPGMLSWMETDTDFDPIRAEPAFHALMQNLKTRYAQS